MPAKWNETGWAGGRTRDVNGRTVWMLEKRWKGQRHSFTLRVTSEADALAELALWNRDPEAYRIAATSPVGDGPLRITDELLRQYLAFLTQEGLSVQYRAGVRRYLARWAKQIGRRDLRTLQLRDYRAMLREDPRASKWRIIAVKSFTAWLRREDLLRTQDDGTLALEVPPSRPEKATRTKGYPAPLVEAFYAQIASQDVRDVFLIRAKTGMHDTEIARVARGQAVLRRVDDPCGIVGTLRFIHKSGKVHIVSLDAQGYAAAARLQANGCPPTHGTQTTHIRAASARLTEAAGGKTVEAIHPGELRHSFVTWATNEGTIVKPSPRGVPLADVVKVTGHSEKTASLHYDGTEIPPMIALPLRLFHPKDPTPPAGTVTDPATQGAAAEQVLALRLVK